MRRPSFLPPAVLGLALALAACAAPRPGAGPAAPGAAMPPSAPAPDLLVTGAIHTLDPARPGAEAVLVSGGRFTCVGSRAECGARAAPGTRVVDLGTGSAVPGLADAHGHVFGLGEARAAIACNGAPSAEACAARVAERARGASPGAWLTGRGWDQNLWPGKGFPDRAPLDAAAPANPVLLARIDGHAAWVNGAALAAAGITRETPDPPGGKILRRAGGEPAGVLVDTAIDLVTARIGPPSRARYEERILAALHEAAALGLTAVHDAGCGPEYLAALAHLAAAGRLPVRVYAMIDGQVPLAELERQLALWKAVPRTGLLEVRAVKLYADGALGSRGAALLEDYADEPGNRGLLLLEPAELRARVKAVVAAGLQPAIHAIGDRGLAEVITALEAAGDPGSVARLRPRVEHLQIVRPRQWPRLAALGAIASMQPTHATSDGPWAADRLGAGTERLAGAYAWRSALEAGLPLAFGSDFPIEEPDPRAGLAAAEARTTAAGVRFTPEQRISRAEALAAFTRGAAWAAFAEERRGMIREGLEADLTAFTGDVLAVPVAQLPALPVALTVVAGRIAHER